MPSQTTRSKSTPHSKIRVHSATSDYVSEFFSNQYNSTLNKVNILNYFYFCIQF